MYNIEDLTEQARRSGASDIHLVCGLPPKYPSNCPTAKGGQV